MWLDVEACPEARCSLVSPAALVFNTRNPDPRIKDCHQESSPGSFNQVLVVSSSRELPTGPGTRSETWALLPYVDVTWSWQGPTAHGALDMRMF